MIALLLCNPTFASERVLAWSYGAATVPQGQLEVEPISTVKTRTVDGEREVRWTHEAELEYGLTNSLEAGLYLVTSQTNDSTLSFTGYKARLRYRFWPLGTRPLDLAAYLEYIGSAGFDAHGYEAKLIVAKEGFKVRAALNLTGELETEAGELETVFEPTAGLAWRPIPQLAIGGEAKMETVFGDEMEGPFYWAGPTMFLSGEGGVVNLTLAGLYGLTDASRDDATVAARMLLVIDL